MAARGRRILVVSFGPAATPVLATALAFAREHAASVSPGGPGGHRASFCLDTDPDGYGRAEQLIRMTFSWRATHAELDGRPERIATIRLMLDCARAELERSGACRREIPAAGFPKCRSCPLFDPEWAYACERFYRRPILDLPLGVQGLDLIVPDIVPPEWLGAPPPE